MDSITKNMAQGADIKNWESKSNIPVTNYYPNPLSKFIATVKKNKDFFTKNYIERTNASQKLQ